MIYLIDFNGCSPRTYHRTEIGLEYNRRLIELKDRQILITDPDLEGVSTLASELEKPNFIQIKVNEVLSDRMSVDAMKHNKHYILIDNTWVLTALIKKVHIDCFELSFGGGERIWTPTFGMGEPL